MKSNYKEKYVNVIKMFHVDTITDSLRDIKNLGVKHLIIKRHRHHPLCNKL